MLFATSPFVHYIRARIEIGGLWFLPATSGIERLSKDTVALTIPLRIVTSDSI